MTSPFAKLAAEVCGYTDNLNAGKCPICGCDEPQATIRDELSMKEFKLSQLCQDCQDRIFGGEPDADV